jgi:hypothetical protein
VSAREFPLVGKSVRRPDVTLRNARLAATRVSCLCRVIRLLRIYRTWQAALKNEVAEGRNG